MEAEVSRCRGGQAKLAVTDTDARTNLQAGDLLFIQVIFDRRAYAHSFHQTAISSRGPKPGFAGIAGLVRSQNREDTLIAEWSRPCCLNLKRIERPQPGHYTDRQAGLP